MDKYIKKQSARRASQDPIAAHHESASHQENLEAEYSQQELLDMLMEAPAHGGETPQVFNTALNTIVVGPKFAYKFKSGDFYAPDMNADFRTPEVRGQMCMHELHVNAIAQGTLYHSCAPITRNEETGKLQVGGFGKALDWVVIMSVFEQENLFSNLAENDGLTPELMKRTADSVSNMHQLAEPIDAVSGVASIEHQIRTPQKMYNFPDIFQKNELDTYFTQLQTELDTRTSLLNERAKNGYLRNCHGDLHLQNIALIRDIPVPFDAIEFNPDFTNIDVGFDVAFLIMDLMHRGQDELANIVIDRYFENTADTSGRELLPLFISVRASIRAWVEAYTHSRTGDQKHFDAARKYFQLARDVLHDGEASVQEAA